MRLREDTIIQILDSLYDNVLCGLPGSETVHELADNYLIQHSSSQDAIDSLIRWQTAKCATSGFISGLGGVLALPVSMPAELTATFYIQMRMIAAVAHMNGYDINSDQVKTFIYCCLLGEGIKSALKGVGIKVGKQLTRKAIERMPQEFLQRINHAIGIHLVTKFGNTGIIRLSKVIPVAGGIVGAGVNGYFCYEVGKSAQIIFPPQHDDYLAA
jgi:hypothetical protein